MSARTSGAQDGFTLVELMTSVALTVVLTGAMLGLAQRARTGMGQSEAGIQAVDGWREAMADLCSDLRLARTVAAGAGRVIVGTASGDVMWVVRDGVLVRTADGEPPRHTAGVVDLQVVTEGASRRVTLAVKRPGDRRILQI